MEQERILKNHWKIVVIIFNFLLQSVVGIGSFMEWIGYMNIFQIITLVSVMLIFFSGIQFMTYTIKKSAGHQDDYIIDTVINLFLIGLVKLVLLPLPFNAITVVIFALGCFGCIFSLAFFFSKFLLKKADVRKRFNIFFVTVSITFILAFIMFDLVYLILLYATGILQIVLFNKKYNILKNHQYPKRIKYIIIGTLIFLFVFLAFPMVFY